MEYNSEIFSVQTTKEGILVSLLVRPETGEGEDAKEYNFHCTRIHPGAAALVQIIDSQEAQDAKKQNTA